jgi:ankyrin repeat protein
MLKDIGKLTLSPYSLREARTGILKTEMGCKYHTRLNCWFSTEFIFMARSAADGIWLKLLHKGNEDEKTSGFWKLVVLSEDEYDLELAPIHRIVVGLSGVSLQSQLESDASGINDPDWQGRTPLMWAAIRDDCANVQILLSESADVSRYGREGRTAPHMGIIGGCHKCVLDILEAGGGSKFP